MYRLPFITDSNFTGCCLPPYSIGEYYRVLPILTARVPIVKLSIKRWLVNYYNYYSYCSVIIRRLEADISLENTLALHNTRMLALYNWIDDRVRPLGFAIKYFAKVRYSPVLFECMRIIIILLFKFSSALLVTKGFISIS